MRSALAQRWPTLEVLVVDDASTDASPAILERLAAKDPRIRILSQHENRGVAAARNAIVENAGGAFIAVFDDDDESRPDRLSRQVNRIVAYEDSTGADLVICHAARRQHFPDGRAVYEPTLGMDMTPGPHGQPVIDLFLLVRPIPGTAGTCATCSQMARRGTYRRIGGFDTSFRRVEDVDFAVRLALAGGHFIGCTERLYCQHATIADDKTPMKNYESEMRLLEKHRAFLESRGRYGYARRWFTMRYHHFTGAHVRMAVDLAALWLRYPLAVSRHLLSTGPARLWHERRMKRERP